MPRLNSPRPQSEPLSLFGVPMPTLSLSERAHWRADRLLALVLLLAVSLFLLLGLAAPLLAMLQKSVQDGGGQFVGLANFQHYLASPQLRASAGHTLLIGLAVSAGVVLLAFGYAFALTRSCMPGRRWFRLLANLPILAPSLLPAISLIYLFGNQGMLKSWLMGESIYGPIGILLGLGFWCFPHALMLLCTTLATADARLYEAARVLKLPSWRRFVLITLANARYGILSALVLVFTLAVCDFAVAKVIGGQYSLLATDIFKQVVGQQNFTMGAVTSVFLLLPALLAFGLDRWLARRQRGQLASNAVIYRPVPHALRDGCCLVFCSLIALFIVTLIGVAIYGSLVSFWPWDLGLSLRHYDFASATPYGWQPWFNSLTLAAGVALFGSALVMLGSYLVEKVDGFGWLRRLISLLGLLPMAVPGMVLGLGYIFFFNQPGNPLSLLYGTMALLVINSLCHYYTVGQMTMQAALKQLPSEIETVASSLKLPRYLTFWRITLPVCSPALLDVAIYLFVNALTTTSALVFLYAPDTLPAAIAILNLDDAGQTGSAAAMAVLLLFTAMAAKGVYFLLAHLLGRRTQRWRQR